MLPLNVLTWGTGPQRALLIHGISSNAAGWWRVGPALADLGFTVTAPDLRGHGASPGAADYTLAAYTEDILALSENWDLILGHSLGGAAAVLAHSARPAISPRLILEDPALAIPAPDFAVENLLRSYEPPISPEEVSMRNPTWHPEDCRMKVEALLQSRPWMVEQTIRQNDPWNLVEETAAITVPTLLLAAEIEPVIPAAFGDSLSAMNGHLTFEVIAGSSHSMHRDEFDAFIARVAGFVT